MPQLSRVGDGVSHGGSVTEGSPLAREEGKAVARVGDGVNCSLHGAQTLTTGSALLFVDGRPCALVGSLVSCGATVTSGAALALLSG